MSARGLGQAASTSVLAVWVPVGIACRVTFCTTIMSRVGIAYIMVRFLHYRAGRSLGLPDSVRTSFLLEFVYRISTDAVCIQDLITDHIAKDLLCTSILHA